MIGQLKGKRILIVEHERMIAENIAFEMAAEGAEVIGPVETMDAALDAIANTDLDAVTLDIKLRGERAYQVGDALAARNIPFLFLTGYGAADVPPRYASVVRLEKPVAPFIVCRTVENILAARSIPSRVP